MCSRTLPLAFAASKTDKDVIVILNDKKHLAYREDDLIPENVFLKQPPPSALILKQQTARPFRVSGFSISGHADTRARDSSSGPAI